MRELTVEQQTSASPDKVWSIITNLEEAPNTISGILSIERSDGGSEFGVGSRWRETRRMFGKESTETMEVTGISEGHSYTTEARSHGARYQSSMRVDPIQNDGSRITMTFGAEPEGRIARLMAATLGRFFERATRKTLEQDLADIAATAERAV